MIGNHDRGGTLFHRHGQLAELFLHPLAFGDVAVAAALAEPAPVGVINRLAMMVDPAFLAAAGEDAKVQAADLVAGLRDFLVVFLYQGQIVRMGDFQRQLRVGQKFLGAIAGDAFGGRRDVEEAAIRPAPDFHVVGPIGHRAEFFFALPKLLFRLQLLVQALAHLARAQENSQHAQGPQTGMGSGDVPGPGLRQSQIRSPAARRR